MRSTFYVMCQYFSSYSVVILCGFFKECIKTTKIYIVPNEAGKIKIKLYCFTTKDLMTVQIYCLV